SNTREDHPMPRFYIEVSLRASDTSNHGTIRLKWTDGSGFFTDYAIQVWAMAPVNLPCSDGLKLTNDELSVNFSAPTADRFMVLGLHTSASSLSGLIAQIPFGI